MNQESIVGLVLLQSSITFILVIKLDDVIRHSLDVDNLDNEGIVIVECQHYITYEC